MGDIDRLRGALNGSIRPGRVSGINGLDGIGPSWVSRLDRLGAGRDVDIAPVGGH
jgi:hypothetical protein